MRNLAREEDSFTIQIINKALEVVQPEPNPCLPDRTLLIIYQGGEAEVYED